VQERSREATEITPDAFEVTHWSSDLGIWYIPRLLKLPNFALPGHDIAATHALLGDDQPDENNAGPSLVTVPYMYRQGPELGSSKSASTVET
jgi:hypothetical protein